jgi:hypothetical protein
MYTLFHIYKGIKIYDSKKDFYTSFMLNGTPYTFKAKKFWDMIEKINNILKKNNM